MNQVWIGRGALLLSISVHGWLISIAPAASADFRPRPEPTLVEFTALSPEPAPIAQVEPEPEPQPQAETPLPLPVEAPPPVADQLPADAPTSELAEEQATPELTGTTLVADGVGDFSAEVGSGRARRGAIRAGISRPEPDPPARRPTLRPVAPKSAPPSAVPLAELSRKPVPPQLGGALKRNYPDDARRQGKAGEAKVRARVEASGSINLAKVSFESAEGFGTACRKTLLDSRWTAPLDRKGKPVATWISYSCKFRID